MNTTTTTKIPTYAAGEIEAFAMENCRLMLLSSRNAAVSSVAGEQVIGRMFDCKTCGRKFPSFQALGGHRASHKKAKLQNSGEIPDEETNIPAKPKVHACRICGVEFPIGQALGGHMRRHRELLLEGKNNDDDSKTLMVTSAAAASGVTSEGSLGNSDVSNNCGGGEKKRKNNVVVAGDEEVVLKKVVAPVMKKSSSCKRVRLELDLDLSLWWKKEQIDEYNCDHEVDGR